MNRRLSVVLVVVAIDAVVIINYLTKRDTAIRVNLVTLEKVLSFFFLLVYHKKGVYKTNLDNEN